MSSYRHNGVLALVKCWNRWKPRCVNVTPTICIHKIPNGVEESSLPNLDGRILHSLDMGAWAEKSVEIPPPLTCLAILQRHPFSQSFVLFAEGL